MLADAIAAELTKFLRQRSTLFWGFCAVPLAMLAWSLGLDTYLKLHAGGPMTAMGVLARIGMRVDPGQQIVGALARADTAFFKIFFAVGAAGIFGNEYRWETWRLLTPRNTRTELTLDDGRRYPCRIIDLSLSGAAIDIEVRPALGTPVQLGSMKGRVVRHFQEGVAIEFSSVQSKEALTSFL